MADNVSTQTTTLATVPGSTRIATDEVTYSGDANSHIAPTSLVVIAGAEGSKTATPVPAGGGVEAAALRVTIASDSTGVLSVDDNGGSLTVDNAVLSVTGGGVEASALRVTIASDSTGVLSVDDNGASLTVDNAALSVTGGGVESSALRVTIASDSTGVLSVDDNGGSLTVDGTVAISGTVAVTQSGTWDEIGINDSGNSITVDDGGGSLTVDGTVGISGTVTVGSHAVTNAGTFAVQVDGSALTALQLLDNIVLAEDAAHGSGDPGVMSLAVRRDAASSLAGTDGDYAPLQLDSAGSLRVVITGGAGSGGTSATDESGYTPTSSAGTPVMGAVDETAPDAAAEGTLAIIRSTLSRALHVNLRDASGAEVAVGGGTQYTEDAAAAADPTGTALILVRQDTLSATTVSADGDNIAARAANTGAQYVEVTAGTTRLGSAADGLLVNLGANNDVTVTGTVTANLAAGTNNIGDVDVLTVPAPLSTTGGGTEAAALRVTIANDSTGLVSVDDNGGALTVDNGGTFAVQVDGAALTALQLIDNIVLAEDAAHVSADPGVQLLAVRQSSPANLSDTNGDYEPLQVNAGRLWASAEITALPASTNTIEIVGDVAHDAAIGGNPVRIGGRALSADYTAVASGDAADIITTLTGKVVNYSYALPGSTWSYAAASGGITNTTGVTARAAAGAGIRNYITRAQVINGHATVSTDVQIRDGASGTVLWRGFAQAAGGGVSCKFDPPLRGTANTLVEVACGTTGTATYFNLQGFQAAE